MNAFQSEDARQYISEHTFALSPADNPGKVGLEIEMQPYFAAQPAGAAVPKSRLDQVLLSWAKEQDWKPLWEESDDGRVVTKIDLDEGDTLSFEPGGQVEFSSKPYSTLTDAIERATHIQTELDRRFAEVGVGICQIGINPWHTVDQIGLQMRKPRYEAMNQYFHNLSEYGPRMMRQTCTVQVCLDFGSTEEVMAKRYLLSQLLAPIASAIFCHSPVVDGALVQEKSFRVKIWNHMDPSRAGFTPGLDRIASRLTKASCVEAYSEFALKAQVIFVKALGYEVPTGSLTFEQWSADGYKGVYPTEEDWLTQLSLLFPEVRPKGFLELRSVDAQHRLWQEVPALFYIGLLYDDQNLDRSLDLLLPHLGKISQLWREAPRGLEHPVLRMLSQELVLHAIEGYERWTAGIKKQGLAHKLRAFFDQFTSKGRTPAHDLCQMMENTKAPCITKEVLMRTSDLWLKSLAK